MPGDQARGSVGLIGHGDKHQVDWLVVSGPGSADPIGHPLAQLSLNRPGFLVQRDRLIDFDAQFVEYIAVAVVAVGHLRLARRAKRRRRVGARTAGRSRGLFGGWVDAALMRAADGMLAIPIFFFLLIVLAVYGPTLANIIVAIGLTSWMGVARVVRSEVLRTAHLDYVAAARALGAQDLRVLGRHILPQAIPSIIVASTLGVAQAILVESALSYLGLGVQPPQSSWGNMLSNAQSYVFTAPQLAIYPGVAILLTVLACNTLGDALRDALDPTEANLADPTARS